MRRSAKPCCAPEWNGAPRWCGGWERREGFRCGESGVKWARVLRPHDGSEGRVATVWTGDGTDAWACLLREIVKVVVALPRVHKLRGVSVVSDGWRGSAPLNVHHCKDGETYEWGVAERPVGHTRGSSRSALVGCWAVGGERESSDCRADREATSAFWSRAGADWACRGRQAESPSGGTVS